MFGETSANSFIRRGKSLYSELSPMDILKVISAMEGSNFSASEIVFCIRDKALLTSFMI